MTRNGSKVRIAELGAERSEGPLPAQQAVQEGRERREADIRCIDVECPLCALNTLARFTP